MYFKKKLPFFHKIAQICGRFLTKLLDYRTFLKIFRLHEEIEDFYQWMVPTQHEHYTRLGVVYRVRKAILKRYPACRVDIFGSFRTGLYLPTR